MSQQITDVRARSLKPGDRPIAHGKVPGLRLEPGSARGRGKWILRYVSPVTGKRRDRGLGVYPDVSIADVRIRAEAARALIAAGSDPIEVNRAEEQAAKAQREALTFENAARQYHEEQKAGWRNEKHRAQWINTLQDYVFPKIGSRKVGDLAPADFADALRVIWLTKPETASRVRQRCQSVMKWCWAHGMITGNPVDVVDHLLPQQPGKRVRVQHHPAMPWREIPAFFRDVLRAGKPNPSRTLLEFVILTAARSGEARQMRWDEVDLNKAVWTVPAARMKAKVVHRVPLCPRAVEILKSQRATYPEAELVFPAPRGGVLSDMVLTKFLRDHNAASSEKDRVATAHGFRSSFRDWASENGYPRDLAERALAHTIANQAEPAYHRTDLLEQRNGMMASWAAHCASGHPQEALKMEYLAVPSVDPVRVDHFVSVDPARVDHEAALLRGNLPELSVEQSEKLAHCLLRCLAIKEAVETRKVHRKNAGRKPNYPIAVLLADIVASGLAEQSDLDRLASGSYWEERPRHADAQSEKVNRLEKLARAVLGELDVHASSLQTQARRAKKFLMQIHNLK